MRERRDPSHLDEQPAPRPRGRRSPSCPGRAGDPGAPPAGRRGTDEGQILAGLRRWNTSPRTALDQILPAVASELRRMAASLLEGEARGHALEPADLVHELYLRLLDRRRIAWQDSSHFFGFAARTMRRILVEHARARNRIKRGCGARPESLDAASQVTVELDFDRLALELALGELARSNPRRHRVVELRLFDGLTFDQIADSLKLGSSTVRRHWSTARVWLVDQLRPRRPHADPAHADPNSDPAGRQAPSRLDQRADS